ncbi:MAG: WbqC family protein, partial [Candidatus Kerfeldbacteria bacterium]|nr:WbqC family protein [Candidatus Kerfeldbacteria bacterium]
MAVRLAGYQPQYFPRLHYFARVLNADIFKVSDYVQFVRAHTYLRPDGSREHRGKSYQAHSPIKLGSGLYFLTVPVVHHGMQPINQTAVSYAKPWPAAHLRTIQTAYARAERAAEILPQVSAIVTKQYQNLAELNIATIFWALAVILGRPELPAEGLSVERLNELLNTQPHPFRLRRIVIISQTGVPPRRASDADSTNWIIESCRRLGASEYYHGGTAAAAYLDHRRLVAAGITPIQQQWTC